MTPDEQIMLALSKSMANTEMSMYPIEYSKEEYFIAGWKAAVKHMEEKREQWELSTHRRE